MNPAPTSRALVLDTNILIYALQGLFTFKRLAARYGALLISRVTEVEALGFVFATMNEEMAMQQLIARVAIIDFGAPEAQHAIAYRKFPKKIKLPDAAILATARAAGADLLTQNTTDFTGFDPAVRLLSLADF